MRLAIVTNESLGEGHDAPSGFSVRYVLMARCLAELGHDVLALSFGMDRPATVPADALARHPLITYHSVDSLPGSPSPADQARRLLRGAALRLGSTAYARPWEREVSNVITAFEPDVAIVAAPYRPITCALVPTGLPLVYFVEEDLSAVSAPVQFSAAVRARRIDLVVTISTSERRWASERFAGVPVVVVPHVVDVDHWAAEEVRAAPDGAEVLCAGDFAHRRNADGLRDVVASLGSEATVQAPIRIAVASARPFESGPLPPCVDLVDFEAVDDLRPYYRAATAALVPSFVVTGVKTQILQAWASGTPVVTTGQAAASVGGCQGRDLIVGDTPTAVAQGLVRVLSDQALRLQLIEGGRASAGDRFSTDVMTSALQQMLEKVQTATTTW